MKPIRAMLLDMEGVLVHGSRLEPFPDAGAFMAALRSKGLPVRLVTNHTVRPPAEIARRLREAGIPLAEDEILSPLSTCPQILEANGAKRLFVMGTDGLKRFLAEAGFEISADPRVDAVVLAKDLSMGFTTIKTAATALKRHGALLCALNDNRLILDDDGLVFPGPGAMAALFTHACGYPKPVLQCGKMSPLYNDILFRDIGIAPSFLAIVSDDLETDIRGYAGLGLQTILTTTGKCSRSDARGGPPPDLVVDSLTDLMAHLGW